MSAERMQCWSLKTGKNITSHSVFYNDIALCCVNIATMLLSLFASGLVVHRYYQTRARQPVSNTLLFLLAFLNVLQSVAAHPLFISMLIFEFFGIFYCTLRNITETALSILLGFTFLMVTFVLTTERFFAIMYPIYHRVYMRNKMLICATSTLLAAWTILIITFQILYPRPVELNYVYLFVITFGLAYTMAVYVKIFSVSRRSTTSRRAKALSRSSQLRNGLSALEKTGETSKTNFGQNCPAGINIDSSIAYKSSSCDKEVTIETPCQKIRNKTHDAKQTFKLTAKEKKTIFRMLSIVGVLYFTSAPITAAFTYEAARGTDAVYVNYLFRWGVTMSFTSGVINAYIYFYKNEHFRTRCKPAFKNSIVSSSVCVNDSHFEPSRSQQNSGEEVR